MRESRMRTLVLYAHYTTRLSYYDDWLEALVAAPGLDATALNICAPGIARELRRQLPEADLTILLHSTNGDTTLYLEPIVGHLRDRPGRLVSFVGNEVNLPGSPMAQKRRILSEISPDFIATQLLAEAGEFLFGDLVRHKVISVPHALNPRAFQPQVQQAMRPIDIGVRAARYIPHLGDNCRNQVHDFFAEHPFDSSLAVDIGTQRLDRSGWAEFLNRCKGTVSTEAGSWYLERDDRTVEAIREYVVSANKGKGLIIRNDSAMRRLGHKLPWPLRAALRRVLVRGPIRHESLANEALPFEDVFDQFFKCRPRCPAYSKCISSRHFDAIGTKTVQIMLPGRYNDILKADQHYIALAPDFSNIQDVMKRFRDLSHRETMANQTHEYAMAEHTYDRRITALCNAVAPSIA
jgi:hypothetical protein